MSILVLFTSGSHGIGAAISVTLSNADYQVTATYAGNNGAASAFAKQTSIKTFRRNDAHYDEWAAGIAKVEKELGPVDILVNNAGITRDAPFHKVTTEH